VQGAGHKNGDTLCWLAGKVETRRQCTERETEGYIYSLPSLSLFQFLQWGKNKRKLALLLTRVIFMKNDQAVTCFEVLGKKHRKSHSQQSPRIHLSRHLLPSVHYCSECIFSRPKTFWHSSAVLNTPDTLLLLPFILYMDLFIYFEREKERDKERECHTCSHLLKNCAELLSSTK